VVVFAEAVFPDLKNQREQAISVPSDGAVLLGIVRATVLVVRAREDLLRLSASL
jgi:hypothetical protein